MTLRNPIKADAVDNAFNDEFMDGLRNYLPRVNNMERFTQGVRSATRAARISRASEPSGAAAAIG